jgi:hypothetical protein
MKPTDFITENHNIVQAVVEMHDDHEIQMAREQCYTAASHAIELHRMLKHITERQGLEGWVQEKITLASDYLRQVKEWMEYEMVDKLQSPQPMGETASGGATGAGSVAVAPAAMKKMQRRMREEDDQYDPVASGDQARKKIKTPAFLRKSMGQRPATLGDVERSQQYRSQSSTLGQLVNKK